MDKNLLNHSIRKHFIQMLVDDDISPKGIIQMTRNKNVNSLNNFSTLSGKKQLQISAVLFNTASTTETLSTVSIEGKLSRRAFYPVHLQEVYFKTAFWSGNVQV